MLNSVSQKILLLVALLMLASSLVQANKVEQLDILAIHSYHQEYPWTASQYKGFKRQLEAEFPEYVLNFSTEYLDTKRIDFSEAYQKKFIHYLHAKYKNNLPDLVYVTDDNALQYIHLAKERLIWSVPIVFSGINNTNFVNTHPSKLLAGIFELKNIRSSILLAKQIEPDLSRIIFLGDGGTTDSAIKAVINDARYKKENIEYNYLGETQLDIAVEKLNSYTQGVVILTTIGGIRDSDGRHLELPKIIKALTSTGKKILVMEDTYLLEGVLGGYVTSGESQGVSAANIAAQIIRGEDVSKVKSESQVLSEFILSWPEMQRFGLSQMDGRFNKAKIINETPPLLERYPDLVQWLLWIVLLLFMVLMGSALKARRKNLLLQEQYTDKVTGLQNRVRLLSDINASISPCLIIIDINNFKSINNLYGLKVGDDLLNSFGRTISEKISSDYRVYRIGGNQFGLLNKHKLHSHQVDAYISSFLKDIQHNHYYIDDLDISLTLTAGISRNERDRLIPRAEQALQQAKEMNKAVFVIDNLKENTDQHLNNLLWAQKVNSALTSGRIIPYFQSITDNKTGKINKFEALARLIDEDGSIVAPFFFLEAAKTTRQYASLTKVMIEKTFQAISNKSISVSVNFTVDDIRNEKTINYFKSKLDEYNVANQVIVELIESEGIENYKEVAKFIADIKKLGCRVAIDDFGTGYSNFMHLIQLNVDYLKIDGSIIQNIIKDTSAEIVAKTIVQFADQLGIETIAEFVDSQEILDKVCEMGIDYSQGYFLGKPRKKIMA